MAERIQKILASRGLASRRKAEQWIADGRVSCNGRVCALGDVADPENDLLLLDGKPLPAYGKRVYIMLNKPRGYVTTLQDEKGRKDVTMLTTDCPERVYPVGRLDMDSEGLLLLTNDGEFANRLMHPSHEVSKTYFVIVDGFHEQAVELLKRPISLDGYTIREPQVELIQSNASSAQLRVTIHEGRNRQVRRMCAAAGLHVRKLQRICEGSLQLGKLPLGKWRYLTETEIKMLQG